MATDFGFQIPKETLQQALSEIEQKEKEGQAFVLEVSAHLISDGTGYEVANLGEVSAPAPRERGLQVGQGRRQGV